VTPRRGVVLLLTLVLAALLALGMWGTAAPPAAKDDDHYISIAISQPQIFHPTPGGGTKVSANVVERTPSYVAVEVISDNERFRVLIDPQTDKVEQVIKE
jgi:hypothetical protein